MFTAKLNEELAFNEDKPAIKLLFETESTKEIRILMKKGQLMKKHQTPYPISVELFSGAILFGVEDKKLELTSGALLALEGGVPHDLEATEDSIIRLTLSKKDAVQRVVGVSQQ